MRYTAWSAYGPDAVPLERINPDRVVSWDDDAKLMPATPRKYKQWTEEEINTVARLVAKRWTTIEIAKFLGRPLSSCSGVRSRLNKQQTAQSPRAGGVEERGQSLPQVPSPTNSSLENLGGVSKSASPIFSNRDRLQLIADGE